MCFQLSSVLRSFSQLFLPSEEAGHEDALTPTGNVCLKGMT